MPSEGAGILYLPETLSYAKSDADFTTALYAAMLEPITAASSASSRVPLISFGPDLWDALVNGG